jgi:hypothetical protein
LKSGHKPFFWASRALALSSSFNLGFTINHLVSETILYLTGKIPQWADASQENLLDETTIQLDVQCVDINNIHHYARKLLLLDMGCRKVDGSHSSGHRGLTCLLFARNGQTRSI